MKMRDLLRRITDWYGDHYMLVGYVLAVILIGVGVLLGIKVRAILFFVFLVLGVGCGIWHTPMSQF